MEQLLSKWAESAPDECVFDEGEWMVLTNYGWACNEHPKYIEGDILYATMQAIQRRGWDWMLYSSNQDAIDEMIKKRIEHHITLEWVMDAIDDAVINCIESAIRNVAKDYALQEVIKSAIVDVVKSKFNDTEEAE